MQRKIPTAAPLMQDLSFRRQVDQVHRLGPRVVTELLAEISAELDVRDLIVEKVRRYAALQADGLYVTCADRMPPVPLFLATGTTS